MNNSDAARSLLQVYILNLLGLWGNEAWFITEVEGVGLVLVLVLVVLVVLVLVLVGCY